MSGKLLARHHLEFLRLKGGSRGSSESALVKMAHCCKSHITAQIIIIIIAVVLFEKRIMSTHCSSM